MSPASPATETIDDAFDSSETNFSVVPADYANWSQARRNAYMTAAAKAYANEQRANTRSPTARPEPSAATGARRFQMVGRRNLFPPIKRASKSSTASNC